MDQEWRPNRYWRNRPAAERVANLMLPLRYANASVDNLPEPMRTAMTKWVDSFETDQRLTGVGLYIWGDRAWRDQIAAAVLKALVLKYQRSGFYVTTENLVEMFYAEQGGDGELPEEYPAPYLLRYIRQEFNVVVMADLGEERHHTAFLKEALMGVVSRRYDAMRPIIFTSGMHPSTLGEHYTPAFAELVDKSTALVNQLV